MQALNGNKMKINILSVIMIILSTFLYTQINAEDLNKLEEPDICYTSKHIDVPQNLQNGVGWRDFESDYELYLSSYRRGWWRCVEAYVKNIDYKYNEKDSRINGRGAAISGFDQGYLDANEIIKKNIKVFGKEKVHSYLEEIWEGA
jgi:hypothetical protein